MLPSFPIQVTLYPPAKVGEIGVNPIVSGSVNVTDVETVQPFKSVTVTE